MAEFKTTIFRNILIDWIRGPTYLILQMLAKSLYVKSHKLHQVLLSYHFALVGNIAYWEFLTEKRKENVFSF